MVEKKPIQNPEKKTELSESRIVEVYPIDKDATLPRLKVMRSPRGENGARWLDDGWFPGNILYICDVNSEEGIGDNVLLVQTHKFFRKTNGEYTTATKNILLSEIQRLNDNFNVEQLYRKTPEEMVAEGIKSVESILSQRKSISDWNSLSTAETGLDESDSPELNRFDERVLKRMKPLETDVDGMPFKDEPVRENYFDHLYDPNYEPPNDVEAAAVRNPKGVPISENSLNAAEEVINSLATNPFLMQIINPEGALDSEVDSKEIMNNIRSSHLTRCRLFEYLTSRLNNLAADNPRALAERVLHNSKGNLKIPNHLGGDYYKDRMRSREYTVVLAIAMMDGSFNVDRQDEVVTHYRDGKGRCGMHRDSARVLLEYVSKRDNY
jgi:hypothetical protein